VARLTPDEAERQFIDVLHEHLAGPWEFQDRPIAGSVKPDVVVQGPEGNLVVADIKFGEAAAHFGSLAQVASYVNLLHLSTGRPVRGFLVTDQAIPPTIAEAADRLGVNIVSGEPDDVRSRSTRGLAFNFLTRFAGVGIQGFNEED
jgi:hypothetical protein